MERKVMTTEEKKREQDQYDNPWKDILNRYLPECLLFFFPEVADQIDWSKGYEFLDKELEQIAPKSAVTQRTVDKLVKVFIFPPKEPKGQRGKKTRPLLMPKEIWLLIHIEVQSQYDSSFGVRMYIYNYRIFDRYGQRVVSLAILGDEKSNWRPDSYSYDMLGCKIKFEFPIVKLLD